MVALLAVVLFAAPASLPARAHFTRAQELFAQERYREALAEFTAANEASPREVPDLYFNIAQCHRNLGEPRQAAAALERYLGLRPEAPDRREVRALIAHLRVSPRKELAAVRIDPPAARQEPIEARTEPEPPAERAPPAAQTAPPVEPAPEPAVAPPPAREEVKLAPEPAPPAPEPKRRSRRGLYIGLGVGLGLVATGVTIGLGAGLSSRPAPPQQMMMEPPANNDNAMPPMGPGPMPAMVDATVVFDARGM